MNTHSLFYSSKNAIREKNQALQYLKLGSRIDATASRVQTALRQGQLTKTMGGVVKGLEGALKSMNVEKISKTMDKFEQQFEDLDVRSAYMEGAMDQTTGSMTPENEVSTLIQMVADENGLEVAGQLDAAGEVGSSMPAQAEATSAESDLESRLAALRK